MDQQIFEAFIPSGTELPDVTRGLYTGDPELIMQWVAENSWCRPDMVRVIERHIKSVTEDELTKLRTAKNDLEDAKQRIADAGVIR